MPHTIPSWQPARIEPRAPDLRPEGRPRSTDRRAELDVGRAAAGAEEAGAEARESAPARASLWGLLSGEERVFYLANSGPVTYGPRALGPADVTESRMGSHLDVRG